MLIARKSLFRSVLVIADATSVAIALVGSYFAGSRLAGVSVNSDFDSGWLLLLIIPCWLFSLASAGLYTSTASCRPAGPLIRAHVLASALLLLFLHIAKANTISHSFLLCFLVLSIATLIAERVLSRALLDYFRSYLASRGQVLLIGTADRATSYLHFVGEHASQNVEIVGFLDSKDASLHAVEFETD